MTETTTMGFEKVNLYSFDYWKLNVTLHGITSMLQNSAANMGKGYTEGDKAGGKKRNPEPWEEAADKVYKMPDGQIYVPAIAVRNMMLKGGTGYSVGKRKTLSTVLAGALVIEPDELRLWRAGEPIREYAVNIMPAVVQRARVMRGRPEIKTPWDLPFTAYVEAASFRTMDQLAMLKEMLTYCGQFVGLLDGRPACKMWFGKFTVQIEGL